MVELVLCSTDAEAANLGLFLQHTLGLMAHWRVRSQFPIRGDLRLWKELLNPHPHAACTAQHAIFLGS